MQRLEVSGAVRPIYGSLGVKRLRCIFKQKDLMLYSVLLWIRIEARGRLLWIGGLSWLAEKLLASVEGYCSVYIVVSYWPITSRRSRFKRVVSVVSFPLEQARPPKEWRINKKNNTNQSCRWKTPKALGTCRVLFLFLCSQIY